MQNKSIATEFKLKVGGLIFILLIIEIFYFSYSSLQQAKSFAEETVTRRAYSLKYDIKNQLSELQNKLDEQMDNNVFTELPNNLLFTQFALKQLRDLVEENENIKSVFIADGSPYVIDGFPLHTLKWASADIIHLSREIVSSSSPSLTIQPLLLSNASLGQGASATGRLFYVVPLREKLNSLVKPYRYTGALFVEVDIENIVNNASKEHEDTAEFIEFKSKDFTWYSLGQAQPNGFTHSTSLFDDDSANTVSTITVSHSKKLYTDRITDSIYLSIGISILDLAIIILFLNFFGRRLITPLKSLEQQCQDFSAGKLIKSDNKTNFIELKTLQDTFNLMTERLQEQVVNLTEQKEKAELSERAKSSFLANMSHEIRTPMNGILGTLQLLDQTQQTEENKELVQAGLSSANSLLHLLNDILDFSKMEAGKLSFEYVVYDIKMLFDEVLVEFKDIALNKEVDLRLDVDAKLGVLRKIDTLRTKQILRNLISNALKFTHQGFVKIELKGSDAHIEFSVSDSGIGMSTKQLAHLFNRFSQADASTTRKYGGTGLGLSIVKQLVEMMKGEITVTSKESEGTRFSISLPIPQETQAIKKVADTLVPPNLSGKLILLAEDNRINQTVFSAMMKKTGAQLIIANDGVEAVSLTQKHNPDAIFMDIQMPNLDGIGACNQLIEQGYKRPIIALTANVMPKDVEYYLSNHFVDCVGKPIELQSLFASIYKHIPVTH